METVVPGSELVAKATPDVMCQITLLEALGLVRFSKKMSFIPDQDRPFREVFVFSRKAKGPLRRSMLSRLFILDLCCLQHLFQTKFHKKHRSLNFPNERKETEESLNSSLAPEHDHLCQNGGASPVYPLLLQMSTVSCGRASYVVLVLFVLVNLREHRFCHLVDEIVFIFFLRLLRWSRGSK